MNEDHNLSLYKLLSILLFLTSFKALVKGYPNVEASMFDFIDAINFFMSSIFKIGRATSWINVYLVWRLFSNIFSSATCNDFKRVEEP